MTLGRRNFFRTAGAGLAFMGVSGLLEACARPVAAPTTTARIAPAVKLHPDGSHRTVRRGGQVAAQQRPTGTGGAWQR